MKITQSAFLLFAVTIYNQVEAQQRDSIKTVQLSQIEVKESLHHSQNKKTTLNVETVNKSFLRQFFTGNLVQTIQHIPGVQSMDVGSGYSKPMIRGMGFNRIAVADMGIKQEGQQWGADHGLEIDAFNVSHLNVLKGPSSLIYGSDAMGGVIEIVRPPIPLANQFYGEFSFLGKTVNDGLGSSLMMGIKKNRWLYEIRYSEQHFADYKVPTDTIVYLTMRIPIYGRRMKNTAGAERDLNVFSCFRGKRWHSDYALSNSWQKMGFFPGAHGIPNLERVKPDGSHWNIGYPNSAVNHLKLMTRQQYLWDKASISMKIAYQYNHRQENSLFHTHYSTQPLPQKYPNKELEFKLHTLSGGLKIQLFTSEKWTNTLGLNADAQINRINGYNFLLPKYDRITAGAYWVTNYKLNRKITLSGGGRYDFGKIRIYPYSNPYLLKYLEGINANQNILEEYRWSSYDVHKRFGDISCSLGMIWTPSLYQTIKINVGRSFRLPGANELAANGVHHGSFRHEKGNPMLKPEQGWQLDAGYQLEKAGWGVSISPFISRYQNYIYLRPTGTFSLLPHSGQLYEYTGVKALFAGGEITFNAKLFNHLIYHFSGEYVYTRNLDRHLPLVFTPPASMRNSLIWEHQGYRLSMELQTIANQNNVAQNEDATKGATLLHLDAGMKLHLWKQEIDVNIAAHNLLNTKYYNHLSFYRKMEIPEPGRNIQILIKVPLKLKLL